MFSRSRPEGRLGCRDPRDPAPAPDPFGIPAPGSGALCTRRATARLPRRTRGRAARLRRLGARAGRAAPPPLCPARAASAPRRRTRPDELSAAARDGVPVETGRACSSRRRFPGSETRAHARTGLPPERRRNCRAFLCVRSPRASSRASWAARASSGTASASAVISATVDGRPSNFCSSGASGVSVPPSRLEMNSTVLCRLMICSCAARRRATVAAVASASPASTHHPPVKSFYVLRFAPRSSRAFGGSGERDG